MNGDIILRVGTCYGSVLYNESEHVASVMAVINAKPGNGHFQKWLDAFAFEARGKGIEKIWFPNPSTALVRGLDKWCTQRKLFSYPETVIHPLAGEAALVIKVKL